MSARVERCDVLFLIRSMGRGGAERQLSLLARTLHARGLNVAVAVFYAGFELESELRDAGVEVLDLKKAGRWSNARVVARLMDLVRVRKPRVLHSYMATQNVLVLMLRTWLRRHDCAVACGIRTALPNSWRYSKTAGLVDVAQYMLLPLADRVISNSWRALVAFDGRIPRGRGFAIPNGVECHRFAFLSRARERQRVAWGVSGKEVVVGLVGRLDPKKNHKLLLDALHVVGKEMREVRVVFVGEGSAEYRDQVRAHACALGLEPRLVWAGTSDDLTAVYSALDILCLCSVTEGFPNVLAEAMCAGLPCVTTEVGDAATLVGDCGWVVPPNDAEALGQALLQASQSLAGWDRMAPRCRMAEHFSVNALADRTLAALSPFVPETPQ